MMPYHVSKDTLSPGERHMTKEQFDAAYSSISKSYKEKIELLEKARENELRRLERQFVSNHSAQAAVISHYPKIGQ